MIPARDALTIQLGAVRGNEPASSFFEVRTLRQSGAPGPRRFVPVSEPEHVIGAVLSELQDVHTYIAVLPRVREGGTAADTERGWTLYSDHDTSESVEALRGFRPLPAIVVQTRPGRLQAYWPLRESVPPLWVKRATRRIAHATGADMLAAEPARILRAIGSRNHKTDPPAEVVCLRCELKQFTMAEVVGSLPDEH